jgi:hypothetical protein
MQVVPESLCGVVTLEKVLINVTDKIYGTPLSRIYRKCLRFKLIENWNVTSYSYYIILAKFGTICVFYVTWAGME